MDGIDIALRAIGAFYVLAGLFAARAALTSNLIDRAIAAISMKKTERVETHRTIWLLALSVLFFAGGVCLMLLLEPAAWIFGASTIVQILFYLWLGPYYFDAADPPPPDARQRSINASVVYGAAALFTIWAAYVGRLISLAEAPPLLWGAAAAAIALHLGYILRHSLWAPKRQSSLGASFGGFDSSDGENDATPEVDQTGADIADSRRIKVMADYGCYPLWAMDEGKVGCFSPYHLGISLDLENKLWDWSAAFDLSLNTDDPANSKWSPERKHQHVEEGLVIARLIKHELPDREIFALDTAGKLIEIHGEGQAGSPAST